MISVILYDNESIVRIAQRAVEIFSDYEGFKTTRDTIWLKGMYLKFAPRMMILNVFDSNVLSVDEIIKCIKNVLFEEEVYVTDNCRFQKYIDKVNESTEFDVVIYGDSL